MRKSIWFVFLLLIVSSLIGCGKVSQTPAFGSLAIKVDWPTSKASVPVGTQSIGVQILKDNNVVRSAMVNASGGASQLVAVDRIPIGAVKVKVSAYNNINATGQVIAEGIQDATITADSQTTVSVTLVDVTGSVSINVIYEPTVSADPTKLLGNFTRIQARPSAGFNFDYYLYVPNDVNKATTLDMLVVPNNTGTVSDVYEFFAERALAEMKSFHTWDIANALKIPLLMPIFPRPNAIYTHALSRDAMLAGGALARLDLQLLAMVDDARALMVRGGINVRDKFFMNGFSASASFTNRFVVLHPERIKAAAIGGFGCLPMIPDNTYDGYNLTFPMGTSDLKELWNIDMNLTAWQSVPQYFYMGDQDVGDGVWAWDCYSPADSAVLEDIFGTPVIPNRWIRCQEILRKYGPTAEFKLYPGIGHVISFEVRDDLVAFFRKHVA